MDLHNIGFNTGQAYGDYLYCSSTKFNGLFKVNMYTGEAFFLDHFPGEKNSQVALYRDSHIYKSQIVFIPQNATGIAVYNIDTDEFYRFELERKMVCQSCLVDSMIWIFPAFGYEEIWLFNVETHELKRISGVKRWKDVVIQKVIYYKNMFWAANYNTNTIFKINAESMEIDEVMIDCPPIYAVSCTYNGLWLITKSNDAIYFWNPETNELSKKRVEGIEGEKQMYIDVIETRNKMLAIPLEMAPILSLDKDDMTFKVHCDYPKDFKVLSKGRTAFFLCRVNTPRGWCIMPSNVSHVTFIEKKNSDVHFVEVDFTDSINEQEIKERYINSLRGEIIIEHVDITLPEYIHLVNMS